MEALIIIIGASAAFAGLAVRLVRTNAADRQLTSGSPCVDPLSRIAFRPTWKYCGRAMGECPVPSGTHPWKDKTWSCAKCGKDASAKVDTYDGHDDLLAYSEAFAPDPDGWLVSSRLPDGRHAPAIDIDFAARLDWSGEGHVLTLDRPVSSEKLLFVLRVMWDIGLAGYEGYERLERDIKRPPAGIPGDRAPDGHPRAVIELAVPARLVPSQTEGHFHLYIEKSLEWMDYERLLRAMTEAGFVEQGFYKMSLRRGMSMLRKPGIEK